MTFNYSSYPERLNNNEEEKEISHREYNFIIGCTLLYGFFINFIMTAFFYDPIFYFFSSNIAFFIVFIGMTFGGAALYKTSHNPVFSFIGYNIIVIALGFLITMVVSIFISEEYISVISSAIAITVVSTVIMLILGMLYEKLFLSSRLTLLTCLLITLVVSLVASQMGFDIEAIDYIIILILSLYVGSDWARANNCAKTVDNAIDSAADLYIDITNLFLKTSARLRSNKKK